MLSVYDSLALDGARHEIRLLRLQPAASLASPLRICLIRGSLDVDGDLPPYEALSYVWGSLVAMQNSVRAEMDNGSTEAVSIPVTANLDSALRHLRYRTFSRTLWVDALCINQADVEERGMQVHLMRSIYERCTADLAWLGPDPAVPAIETEAEDAEKAQLKRIKQAEKLAGRLRDGLRLMRVMAGRDSAVLATMMQKWRRYSKDDRDEVKMYWEGEDDDDDDDKSIGEDTPDKETGWYISHAQEQQLKIAFTSVPFWSRVWIVQELSCAPHVILVAGIGAEAEDGFEPESEDHVLELDFDSAIVDRFLGDQIYADAFHSFWGHGEVRPVLSRIFSRVKAIQLQRSVMKGGGGWEEEEPEENVYKSEQQWQGEPNSLIDVLARFKWTHSTDPRDKVYGLLGMVAETAFLPRISYAKSVADVYTDASLAIIKASGGCLDLLSQNPFQGDDDNGDNNENDEEEFPPSSRSHRVNGLPSWVPNFDRSMYPDYYDEFSSILFAQRGIYAAGRPRCSHSTSSLEVAVPSTDTVYGNACTLRGLRLRGVVLGQVAPLRQGSWTEPGSDPVYAATVFNCFREWASLYGIEQKGQDAAMMEMGPSTYLPTGEYRWQAFWRTLVGDCTAYPVTRLSADEVEACSTALAAACQLREQEIEAEMTEEPTEEQGDRLWLMPTPAKILLAKVPCYAMMRRMMRRRAFVQTDGGLFLMARATAREGDLVVILDGSKVPVLLRRRQQAQSPDGSMETFRYVDTAYVHGFMDGQAVVQVEKGDLDERHFVLV
ncbi:het domain containing protein [Grosmannia clavigera kw1407]|uniref:Het domain containing protein n=1 Tax=Grosmannia clavigera (strain kw1407 / UAMH 11150) TaxID=655863 RepID=F0XAM6_GROCL|nr:het domain containing protein [Grosmannia clavigera kw1407]EFX05970.1 het domain containing protein [Grosmannia clavigera kw1407]